MTTIRRVRAGSLVWDMGQDRPYVSLGVTWLYVDPFPGHGHDMDAVRAAVAACDAATPWSDSVSEVFADDWRVHVAGIDTGYWPHTVPTPDVLPAVRRWWNRVELESA